MPRKYSIKSPSFITWVISSLNGCSLEQKRICLDAYEVRRVSRPKRFAEMASIEEIIVILVKLGFDAGVFGLNKEKKQGDIPSIKTFRDFNENGDIDLIIDEASEGGYFCMVSREVMKMQVLYSQILNGAWYVPNKDFDTLVKVMKATKGYLYEKNRVDFDYDNMKTIMNVFYNFFICRPILDLSDMDYTILFFLAVNDNQPTQSVRIRELFEHQKAPKTVSRSFKKLFSYEYIQRFGSERGHTAKYTITHKGWNAIGLALKEFMRDIKFWEMEDKPKQQHIA